MPAIVRRFLDFVGDDRRLLAGSVLFGAAAVALARLLALVTER